MNFATFGVPYASVFCPYLNICGLQKGAGKILVGVLESPGKVLDFFCQ